MNPYYKETKSKKEKCYIYKKTDGTDKELDLDVHRSFLLFRYFNHNIPENTSPLLPTHLSSEEMSYVYKCVLLSYLSYKDRNIIEFPPEIKLEYEKFDSTVGRIPFFIVTDSSLNAIIISCRGSSCMDDFITDSMGNGVPYDGGKFHEGVFNTASYVFHSCQNKVIELNNTFNGEHVEAHDITDSTQDQDDNLSISDNDNNNNNNNNNNNDDDVNDEKDNKTTKRKVSKSKTSNAKVAKHKSTDIKATKRENKIDENRRKSSKSIPSVSLRQINPSLFNKKSKSRTKIIFTGHSLGAAVAATVAYLFRKNIPQLDAQCICFAPPPTMSFNIWQTTGNFIKSFMIEGDLVPFLSVQNLLHISDIMFPGQTSNQAFKKFVHSYLKKKSVEEVQAIAVLTDTLYPPGQMYLLRFTDADNDENVPKKKKKKGKEEEDSIQLCQILNPDYFSSFVKNIQESNHAIKNYMRMIIRLMNKDKKNEANSQASSE